MIDALMYGASPIAMIEKLSNAHQRSITKYPSPDHVASIVLLINAVISTKGTGIKTSSLYNANIAKVNMIFFLSDLFSKTS